MQEGGDAIMPDERLLERHWLGLIHADHGGGPEAADFVAALQLQAGGDKTSAGVKLAK